MCEELNQAGQEEPVAEELTTESTNEPGEPVTEPAETV
jgi:hypothetical protein